MANANDLFEEELKKQSPNDLFEEELKKQPAADPQPAPLKLGQHVDQGPGEARQMGALDAQPMAAKLSAGIQALYDRINNKNPNNRESLGDAYSRNLKFIDDHSAMEKKLHPGDYSTGKWADVAANTLATLPVGLSGGVEAAAPEIEGAAAPVVKGLASRLGAAALKPMPTAAILGFGQGYGDGRGDVGDNAKEGVKTAALSALLSGALGTAFQGIGEGAGAVKQYLARKAAEKMASEASAGAPELASGVSAAPDAPADLEPTVARRARLGGEVNAAANNAQNRLAQASDAASSADPEAAKFMAGRQRVFNGSRRSTPEYQNTGDLTEVAHRAEIGGANAAPPPPIPAAPPRSYPVTQEVPAIRPGFEGQSAFDTIPGEGGSAPAGLINPVPVNTPEPPGLPEIGGPFRARATGPLAETAGSPEATANIRTPPPPPPDDADPVSLPWMQMAKGAVKGGLAAERQNLIPSIGLSHLSPKLGMLENGLALGHGVVKGAWGELNGAQSSELARQAESFLNSVDPTQQMYGRILLKAAQVEAPKAAAAVTKDSSRNGHPDDNRNF